MLAGAVILAVAAEVAWAARLLHVGTLDALELGDKVAVPVPGSALDWPELRVLAAIAQDIPGEAGLALLHVEWPGHPECTATLLTDLGRTQADALRLLSSWCADRAAISPSGRGPGWFELRRRQSLERVRGQLLSEDYSIATAATRQQTTTRRRTG